jgi:Domain of unknown function (DUF4440)
MWSKRLALAAAVLWAAFPIGFSAQGGVEKTQMEIDAALAKGDKAAYERLLADDFTWVDQAGRLRDKKTVVAELQPPTGKATTEGIDVRSYPGGAVLIATRRNPGGTDVRFLRVSRRDRTQPSDDHPRQARWSMAASGNRHDGDCDRQAESVSR